MISSIGLGVKISAGNHISILLYIYIYDMYISAPLKGGRRHQGVSPFYNRLNKISPTISSRSGNHFLQVPKIGPIGPAHSRIIIILLCSFFPDTQYSAACCSHTRKAVVARNGRTFRATCLNTQFSRVIQPANTSTVLLRPLLRRTRSNLVQ